MLSGKGRWQGIECLQGREGQEEMQQSSMVCKGRHAKKAQHNGMLGQEG